MKNGYLLLKYVPITIYFPLWALHCTWAVVRAPVFFHNNVRSMKNIDTILTKRNKKKGIFCTPVQD